MKKERPFISIVIPTYNRPDQLAACLRACSRLDYPRDRCEVIVVDDGGGAPLDEAVKPFHGLLTLTLLRQENAGPAAARNKGAVEAAGEVLIFTDDDCMPASDWLKVVAAQFVASPDSAVGGETYNALTQNLYSTASQLLVSYLLAYYSDIPERVRFFPSCNVAFPTKQFLEIGGFDLSFPRSAGEDRELCDRWQHRGYRLRYVPEAVVYHAHHLTAKTFLRQHFHYGCGAYYYHLLRARHRRQSMKIEPPAFYANLLAYPFGKIAFGKAIAVVLLLIAAQAANAAGFFWERARGARGRAGSQSPAI
ncbi:MAG: Putative glycosyltransferase [Nitrospira sp.]|nr:MAG: Putative glycosyltransferase [Nitrospira sp.]